MLSTLPVNAVICSLENGATLRGSELTVEGYAMSGDGKPIEGVSVDGGDSWIPASVERQENAWCWAFWSGKLDLPQTDGELEVIARAWDSAGHTQPRDVEDLWNFKGYFNNAWHRIRISYKQR